MRRSSSAFPTRGRTLLTFEPAFVNPWLARKDADWRLDELYDFVAPLGATVVRTTALALDHRRQSRSERSFALSRSGDDGTRPDHDLRRRAALSAGPSAGRGRNRRAAASLLRSLSRGARRRDRSPAPEASSASRCSTPTPFARVIPRLFDGELPVFNLGTNSGASCDPGLRETIGAVLEASSGKRRSSTGASRAAGSRAPTGKPERRRRGFAARTRLPRLHAGARAPGARQLADADRRKARGADARDAQARSRGDSLRGQRLMKTITHCHSRRERSERSGIQHVSRRAAATLDPRSDLRSAEDDKFAERTEPMTAPARIDNMRVIRSAPRNRAQRQELADRSAAAHAHEQSRSRRRRAAGRARRLWRHRAGGARLAGVRPHRRDLAPARGRSDSARPIGQAGRRVPHPRRRAARAHRQLQSRAALGDLGLLQRARSQGAHDVRPDDRGLVDLYRLAGHRAGHLRDLRRDGAPALWRRPSRKMDSHRRPRRHGRRAAARRVDGRRFAARGRVPPVEHRVPPAHRLCRRAGQGPRRRARHHRKGDEGAQSRLGRAARQRGRSPARTSAPRRQARHRHRPDLGP